MTTQYMSIDVLIQVNISDCEEELTSRREFPDGLMIEDLVKGEGKRAKKGKQVIFFS